MAPLVSLEEARAHLRLDPVFGTSPPSHPEDALVAGLVTAATGHLDGWTGVLGRALVTQEWRAEAASHDAFGRLHIPMPVAEVSSVEVLVDGAYEAVPEAFWAWRDMGTYAVVRPREGLSWPSRDHDEAAFRLNFIAGYGEPEDVPQAIRQAALLIVGNLYEHREAAITGTIINTVPHGLDMLIAPYRVRPNG